MEKINAEIVPATSFHAHVIAQNVRTEDAEEIWAAALSTPLGAMTKGMKYSDTTMAGLINGVPVCMWGVVSDSLLFNDGTPWMISSKKLNDDRIARVFLRKGHKPLMEMFKNYDTLENYIDERNLRSIRWLKFLGFTIEEPEPYGILNIPFHRFWMSKEKKDV